MYRIGKEEIEAVARVINSKSLFKINDSGQETMHCEEEAKALFGAKHALLMTSGKAALISALTALGIGPGDRGNCSRIYLYCNRNSSNCGGGIPVIADVDETALTPRILTIWKRR